MHTRHCFIIAALIAGLASLVAPPAHAQTTINIASPTSGTGYTFANNVLTITADGSYTITGTTTDNRIVIAKDVVATITLRDCSITSAVASPFALSPDGCTVALRIEGANTLSSTVPDTPDGIDRFSAGLQVEGAATLTIAGPGSLIAIGSVGAAGIGSGLIEYADGSLIATPVGNIIINGGTITARCGQWGGSGIGTGIGAGSSSTAGGHVTINGGYVTAQGGSQAAGIGSGLSGALGNITITGGTVMAIAPIGTGDPAGIGSGPYGNIGNVSITGGNVFAYGNPAIGRGGYGSVGNISITGGSIIANKIGNSAGVPPVSISGDSTVVLVGSINLADTADIGNAKVTTGVSLSLEMLRLMAANAAAALQDTLRIIPIAHDTTHTTIYDTTHIPYEKHDTTHVPVADTLHTTVELRDTTHLPSAPDTTRIEVEVRDTLHESVDIYDTTLTTVEIVDTVLVPETLIIRDTIVEVQEVEVPVYIVVHPVTGARTVVTDTVRTIEYNLGLQLEGLTPATSFAVYSIPAGALVVHTLASPAGRALLQDLPPGPYLLYHAGKWRTFTHH